MPPISVSKQTETATWKFNKEKPMKHEVRKFKDEATKLSFEIWRWSTRETTQLNDKERGILEEAKASLHAAKEHLANLEEVINLR